MVITPGNESAARSGKTREDSKRDQASENTAEMAAVIHLAHKAPELLPWPGKLIFPALTSAGIVVATKRFPRGRKERKRGQKRGREDEKVEERPEKEKE